MRRLALPAPYGLAKVAKVAKNNQEITQDNPHITHGQPKNNQEITEKQPTGKNRPHTPRFPTVRIIPRKRRKTLAAATQTASTGRFVEAGTHRRRAHGLQ